MCLKDFVLFEMLEILAMILLVLEVCISEEFSMARKK